MTTTISRTTDPVRGVDDLAPSSDGSALLFVPGWCGERTVFDDLASATAQRRRTLVLDLPQHGTRPRSGEDFGTADVVEDVVALLDERGIDRVVPATLSHAGWAAIELRRRLGADRVPGIVFIDWMVLGAPAPFLGALTALQDPESWSTVRGQLFEMWTSGLDIPALHEQVAAMGQYGAPFWHRAAREIEAGFATEGSPVAALQCLEQAGEPCPTLHLYAQPADDAVLAAQQEYAAAHPWFSVRRLDARSHFPMLEVPGEMAEAIEEFTCPLG